jgi:predicted permease
MGWPNFLGKLKRNVLFRTEVESQVDAELRAYLDLLTEEKINAGLDPREARRAALIETGGLEQVKEQCRDVRSFGWLNGLAQDVRYAVRGLRKGPGFTAVAVLSLALGIGANAAIFGMFYAVFLRPLPYPQSDRLYAINRTGPGPGVLTPELILWGSARAFEGVAGWDDTQVDLTGAGTPERLAAANVSANFLSVLRVQPVVGRTFTKMDGRPGATPAAMLTYALWQQKFGGDPAVFGRLVMLDGSPVAIAGVLPPDFRFPGSLRPDLLVTVPLPDQPNWHADRWESFNPIGRLRTGISPQKGVADLRALSSNEDMAGFLKKFGAGNSQLGLKPLQESISGRSRPLLRMLLAAVSLLLLIACVNVANLQLGRAATRSREIGLRAALGASRMRLARLLLIENLALSAVSCAAGFAVALLLVAFLHNSEGLPIAGLKDLQPGWILSVAALALSTAAGFAVGLIPAFLAPRLELNQVLKSGALGVMEGGKSWIRPALVVTQTALALVLLLGSGLLLRSLANVLSIDPGFRPEGVLSARLSLSGSRYDSVPQRSAFVDALLEQMRGMPGVEAAATTNSIPLSNYSLGMMVRREDEPEPPPEKARGSAVMAISPDYFRALGVRLLRGRAIGDQDRSGADTAVVVNARFAQVFFGTQDVIGRRIVFPAKPGGVLLHTIVGVCADTRHNGREAEVDAEIYMAERQISSRRVHVVLRTRGDPLKLVAGLRAAVWSIDKNMPVSDISSMEERLSRRSAGRRTQAILLSAFGLLALCLAAIGIYGVVSDLVNRRTREIGLRMALGARAEDVVRIVMGRSLLLTILGIAAGAVVGEWLVRYLESLLFGTRASDPLVLAGAIGVLLAVALVAGYLPARRAVRIDPVAALRCE